MLFHFTQTSCLVSRAVDAALLWVDPPPYTWGTRRTLLLPQRQPLTTKVELPGRRGGQTPESARF